MRLFSDTYSGRRVLVTGHTGFKGSWLALWLKTLGAELSGLALDPETTPNHWELLGLDVADRRIDIRNTEDVARVLRGTQPEIVFHLAAQPLVRRSYRQPLDTWSTNVMGTANLLDACRQTTGIKAIVVITTDKCYENQEWPWGYRENDRLGGHDPYSASKAATELLVASYRDAYFSADNMPLIATARAGNVIGGGDWSEDRLIPDLVRAQTSGRSLEIRSPHATRPWQHVLDPLCGYLMLGEKLLNGDKEFSGAWNFGPNSEGNQPVREILQRLSDSWPAMRWHVTDQTQPHEATLLHLDTTKAKLLLGWQPAFDLEQALTATAHWYQAWIENKSVLSSQQLSAYIESGRKAGATWIAG